MFLLFGKNKDHKQNGAEKKFRPLTAVLLVLTVVMAAGFYNSRKVILWETRRDGGADRIFSPAMVAEAEISENLKTKLGLDDLYRREDLAWRALKESPLVFGQPEASERVLEGDQAALPDLTENKFPFEAASSTDQGESASTSIVAEEVPVSQTTLPQLTDLGTALAKKSTPFRILIVGDSFMAIGGGLGDPLEKTLLSQKDTIVTRQGKVSSGLSRQNYFDWQALIKKMIEMHRPNVAVMMFGANDNGPVIDGNGKILASWGSVNWDARYREHIDQVMDLFKNADAEIFVVGVPIMKNQALARDIKHINSLFEQEAAKYPKAHYVSTWELLADQNGNYTDYILDNSGKKRLVRTADGVHLQYYAGYYVSEAIVSQMRNYLDLQPK